MVAIKNRSDQSAFWEAASDAGLQTSSKHYTEDEAITLINQYGDKVPSYIRSSWIRPTEIRSPTIKGNNMEVYGAYKVLNARDKTLGYMGAAEGMDATGGITTGVALASSATVSGDEETGITYATVGNYVIATSGGCRMQSGDNSITTTSGSCTLNYNGKNMIRVDSNGCRYTTDGTNWKDIGSGSGGNVVAVWGS